MIYNDFKELKISGMAMGTMRLPQNSKDPGDINEKETFEMVDYAMANGVNYYDTAWGYHSGNSEIVMGKALARHPREKFYLADKFPGYDLANMSKVEEIFEKQLEKCQVDYFDFYLIHNLCELNVDEYLNPANGIKEYMKKQLENGRIKHLGFSIHAGMEVFDKFMEYYGDLMEFCQIQLNYLDYEFQDAKAKIKKLRELGMGVWVMEPVRGGKLADLGEPFNSRLKAMKPDKPIVDWAYMFLQSIPEVVTVLSGASSLEQIKYNIKAFEKKEQLNEKQFEELLQVARDMTVPGSVPCTSCRYCIDHCPQGLDIPHLLNLYNEEKFTKGGFIAPMALGAIEKDKKPESCLGCGACQQVCPQGIKIAEVMKDFVEIMKSNPNA